MKPSNNAHQKMMSVYQLLSQDSISLSSFSHASILLKGIHPDLDEKLDRCEKALDKLQKIVDGDVISLSAEGLPEKDEKQRKRKRLLIFFITSLKNLQSEIKRVDTEFSQGNGSSENLWRMGRIIKYAKGPFGIITLIAVIIVIVSSLHKQKPHVPQTPHANSQSTIQVIEYNGKQIPLSQLRIGNPHYPNCTSQHYHALNPDETVTALDGTVLYDPGNCGFGKVEEMRITSVAN